MRVFFLYKGLARGQIFIPPCCLEPRLCVAFLAKSANAPRTLAPHVVLH